MAPEAVDGGVVFDLPGGVIDGSAVPAVLEGEVGRVSHVEGDHVVVHVAAQIDADGDTATQTEVAARADIVEGVALEHDVVDALGPGGFQESDRVVAGVAVEEGQANLALGRADLREVGDAEAEEVAVEADTFV